MNYIPTVLIWQRLTLTGPIDLPIVTFLNNNLVTRNLCKIEAMREDIVPYWESGSEIPNQSRICSNF